MRSTATATGRVSDVAPFSELSTTSLIVLENMAWADCSTPRQPSLPAVGEHPAQRGRVAWEPSRLEVRVARPDRCVAEAERARGFEAEAPVEGGVTEEDQQGPAPAPRRGGSASRTSADPMRRPWCAGATHTGATPATAVCWPSRRPGAARTCPTTAPPSSATSSIRSDRRTGPRCRRTMATPRWRRAGLGEGVGHDGQDRLPVIVGSTRPDGRVTAPRPRRRGGGPSPRAFTALRSVRAVRVTPVRSVPA